MKSRKRCKACHKTLKGSEVTPEQLHPHCIGKVISDNPAAMLSTVTSIANQRAISKKEED